MTPTKACYNLALWPFWGTKMENDAISISQVASYSHCFAIASLGLAASPHLCLSLPHFG